MATTNGTQRGKKETRTITRREAFLQRVELRMRELSLTQTDLAKATGRNQSTVSDYFNPEVRSLPDGDAMLLMPEALGVNGEWLLTGRGPMQRTNSASGAQQKEQALKNQGIVEAMREMQRTIDALAKRLEGARRSSE